MKTRWKLVAAIAMLALVLAACGGDDNGGGGGDGDTGGPAETGEVQGVGAEEYVAAICTSIGTYVTDITALSDGFVGQLDPTADVQTQKDAVVGLLDDIIATTDGLIEDLTAAGVPDVEGGDAIAAALTDSLQQSRQIIDDAKAAVEELSVDDPVAFTTQLTEIGTAIQNSQAGVTASLGALESPELSEAALNEPACTELAGAGASA